MQSKLSDCEALEDSLRSIVAQLLPVGDTPTAEQLATELGDIVGRHGSTSGDVEMRIRQLETMLRSWDEVRAGMDECQQSLGDARLVLTEPAAAQPLNQHDLQLQSDTLKVVTAAALLLLLL